MRNLFVALAGMIAVSTAYAGSLETAKAQLGNDLLMPTRSLLSETAPVSVPLPAALNDAAPPQTAGLVTVWKKMEKKDANQPILSEAAEIVSKYNSSSGFFGHKKFVTYILKVSEASLPRFQAAGFAPLQEITIHIRWDRISDINGWGTDMNGRITRSWVSEETFASDKLDQGFERMKKFVSGPLDALDAKGAEHILTRKMVVMFERGFVVSSGMRILAGHKWTNDEQVLFAYGERSGYYR